MRSRPRKQLPRTESLETGLVCYSDRKISVRVSGKRGQDAVIYEASSLEPVTRFGTDELEGRIAWSYIDDPSLLAHLSRDCVFRDLGGIVRGRGTLMDTLDLTVPADALDQNTPQPLPALHRLPTG